MNVLCNPYFTHFLPIIEYVLDILWGRLHPEYTHIQHIMGEKWVKKR